MNQPRPVLSSRYSSATLAVRWSSDRWMEAWWLFPGHHAHCNYHPNTGMKLRRRRWKMGGCRPPSRWVRWTRTSKSCYRCRCGRFPLHRSYVWQLCYPHMIHTRSHRLPVVPEVVVPNLFRQFIKEILNSIKKGASIYYVIRKVVGSLILLVWRLPWLGKWWVGGLKIGAFYEVIYGRSQTGFMWGVNLSNLQSVQFRRDK